MWLILFAILAGILYFTFRRSTSDTDHKDVQSAPQCIWKEPTGAMEHLIMFSIIGEAISSFDSAALAVSYTWGAGIDDQVEMTFYGVNNTSVYQKTDVGRYMNSLSGDDWSARCKFTFKASEGGAPYYFRTNDAVLEFVRKYAPHAEIDYQLSSSDFTDIKFSKHDLTSDHLPENISTTVMRAIR